MSSKKLQILIIVFSGIFVLAGILVFLNFNGIKNIEDGLKIWNAELRYPVLGDGGVGGCGNSVVEESSGEECDDGNSIAEDGCSPSCQWENVSMAFSWCGTTSCPVSRIYSQNSSAYDKQFWHIIPVAYVEIADIGKPTEVQRIKNITDGQPAGFRTIINYFYPRYSNYVNTVGEKDNIIIPGTCTDINDLSTCEKMHDVATPPGCSSPYTNNQGYVVNYRSPWWDNWVTENQNRLRTFFNDYRNLGGKQIDYLQSDYEMGFDVGFAKPYSVIPTSDNSNTPCNEVLFYPAYNERVIAWWNGVQNDPRFPAMQARLELYGFSIPAGKTLYEYMEPRRYSWTNFATIPQLIWNSVSQDVQVIYFNEAWYNVAKEYYPNIEMANAGNYLNSAAFPRTNNLYPYGPGTVVGTHQNTGNYSNIEFASFKKGTNAIRTAALATPKTPFRVWLSHWSYKVSSANRQVFNLNYAKYWTENVFHSLLAGTDGIDWWNSNGEGESGDAERTTADRTAESTAMNTMLQEFDSLTYFRQDRTTLVSNLVGTDTNYVLTGMRVPNHYNLYRLTPNQDSGQTTTQILQRNPAIFLVNGTTRIKIPGGAVYTPTNNVAPYGYWIIQQFSGGNPVVETGTATTCVNTCLGGTPDPDPDPDVECTNECISGQAKCSDTSHRQTCGQYDSDTCLEWSTATVCSGDTTCGYGTCPDTHKPAWRCELETCTYVCNTSSTCNGTQPPDQPTTCTNDCTTGQLKCSDISHKQTCGQYDSDTCLEWSTATVCSGSTTCGYGNCSATQKPSWTCKDGKCVYVCVSSAVCKSTLSYIKNYKKACYNNNVYWYDSTGQIQSIYERCQDSCANASCVSSETAEYCEKDSHCPDETCNCQETSSTCPEDCVSSDIVLTLYAKDQQTGEWKQDPDLTKNQNIELLLVVANKTTNIIEDITAKIDLPQGVSYQQNLQIDGADSPENIVFGMSIGSLEPLSEKRITFKASSENKTAGVNAETIKATAKTDDLESASSLNVKLAGASKAQSLLDLIIQFITSHILLTVIIVISAYLVFAVAGYMVFKRIT